MELSVFPNLAVATEEAMCRVRNRSARRSRARCNCIRHRCVLVPFIFFLLYVQRPHECGESPVGNLSTPRFQRPPNALSPVDTINVKRTAAFVSKNFPSAWPEERARP